MSKINIFALGGLNEDGKNMYVVSVDEDIFVFDAGLKYPRDRFLGIDYIIPSFDYLKENKKRIKGIFLSHGHESNIGAISDILIDIPDMPIYAAKYTMEMLKITLEMDNVQANNLNEIKFNMPIHFGNNSIFPLQVTHSIPDSTLYVLNTKDGSIVYTGDFIFDPTMPSHFSCDIGRLAYIGKQNVLCLLTESMYAGNEGFTAPKHRISGLIRETLNNAEGRIIFNVLDSHLYRIGELISEVEKTDRKIIIMGKRLKNIIDSAIENHYLVVNPNVIGDLSYLNSKKAVILNANEKDKPYYNIMRIVGGYDKFIKLNENDTIFLATPIYENREKTFYHLLDEISKTGASVVTLPSKKYLSHHASREDLMTMINLMNPKYYFPIRGEYRSQVENASVAELAGIPLENIILKENGEVVEINKGVLKETFEKVPTGSILIDGNNGDDIGEVVLKDREMLSDNGIMIISVTLNKTTKEILSGPEILTRGFIYVKDSYELLKEIKKLCEEIILMNTKDVKYVEYNKIKNTIRDELSKYLIDQTGNKPMIISVLQEI